ncbi:hypothetical protein E6P97_02965 [Patescibacteria group bacterium]|nr:MAG: hypothetical protein E6P97_02965 [Patescibacteria group bacterium]
MNPEVTPTPATSAEVGFFRRVVPTAVIAGTVAIAAVASAGGGGGVDRCAPKPPEHCPDAPEDSPFVDSPTDTEGCIPAGEPIPEPTIPADCLTTTTLATTTTTEAATTTTLATTTTTEAATTTTASEVPTTTIVVTTTTEPQRTPETPVETVPSANPANPISPTS